MKHNKKNPTHLLLPAPSKNVKRNSLSDSIFLQIGADQVHNYDLGGTVLLAEPFTGKIQN